MLGVDASDISHASAFAIGFALGVITCLRLIGTTFNAALRILRRETIDQPGTDDVEKGEQGNPP